MTHTIHTLPRGTVHVARAEAVYPSIAPGSVSLVISDGPYNMRKADWDKFRTWDDFREWYRPHVEAWTRLCAESATVYVWGTDDSASELRPLMREHGWTKRVRVVWDKVASPAMGAPSARSWPDVTESCDVWCRGAAAYTWQAGDRNVWRSQVTKGGDLVRERLWTGDRRPGRFGKWTEAVPLHPCQKPLDFYGRMIRASSRPGDLVLEPFAGTLRAAACIERMRDEDARRYVCIEPDEDGRGYVPAALAAIRGETLPGEAPSLFDALEAE